MMRCIQVGGIFGKVVAHVLVNEFHKRGLPHAYCTFFLTNESRDHLNNLEYIDTLIAPKYLQRKMENIEKFFSDTQLTAPAITSTYRLYVWRTAITEMVVRRAQRNFQNALWMKLRAQR